MATLRSLRIQAVGQSLFPPTTLPLALEECGFIQADPIRAPARAQDLILRHRVSDYRSGDLERLYPILDVDEDYLYAYGFVSRATWRLLHPRTVRKTLPLSQEVLAFVHQYGEAHPDVLETHLGAARERNAWGSFSKATTLALDHLHFQGRLRILRRDKGIRVYAPARPPEDLPASDRARLIVLLLVRILGPVSLQTLREVANRCRRSLPGEPARVIADLVKSGALRSDTVDDVLYLSLPGAPTNPVPRQVRLLAPFDPVVWDRRRFEHLWGWPYRFEAYTPPSKRVRGYYALPLLFGESVIGWANVAVVSHRLQSDVGFVDKRPQTKTFAAALEQELASMAAFLGVAPP